MNTLARLNEQGIQAFLDYLSVAKADPKAEVPTFLLEEPAFAVPIHPTIKVEIPKGLTTRLELGQTLAQIVEVEGLTDDDRDPGMWAWLTLRFFDVVCPSTGGGRKIREYAAYVPETNNFRRYYRHLLLGPYLIYRAHRDNPERALALLSKPPHVIDDIVGQLASRQEMVTNRGVMELATRLYIDPKTKKTKKGAGSKGNGSPRRLVAILDQFDVTWDLYSMKSAELVDILPGAEFKRFLS
jgi:hypothetical protein